ncbi:MAG TPA: aminotransferase class V-fold PLP-dependent enzyme [Candidatus Acidoferrum sp.]|nr:aminotransferase class V-fold PLP-dependent enzyme [Candidatus Acidoferrum sp.]
MPISRRQLLNAVAGVPALRTVARLAGAAEVRESPTSVHELRKQFPALRQQINGHDYVYLDSAATTQKPEMVIDTVSDFYRSTNANPTPTLHAMARRSYEMYENARGTVAAFVNAKEAGEIVWTRGTTEAINLVASSWGMTNLKPGDEIILTIAEHYSNLVPWHVLANRTRAKLLYIDIDDAGHLRLDQFESLLSKRTKLVAFSHVSNVLSLINPTKQICDRAHEAGARVLIDGAQSIPHIQIDVQDLGCDFFAFSGHKLLGPMGIGVLWARRELLEQMPPYQSGSNMAHNVSLDAAELAHGGYKFGAGTPYASGAIGLASALQFLKSLGYKKLRTDEVELITYAVARLASVSGLRLLGEAPPEGRISLFSFVMSNMPAQQLVSAMDMRGIALRGGDLAALPLLKRLGFSEAVRASLYLYNTKKEMDVLVDALSAARKSQCAESTVGVRS